MNSKEIQRFCIKDSSFGNQNWETSLVLVRFYQYRAWKNNIFRKLISRGRGNNSLVQSNVQQLIVSGSEHRTCFNSFYTNQQNYDQSQCSEAAARMCSFKKLLLKVSQNSEENNYVGVSFLIKLQACNFIQKETPTQACNFTKKEPPTQVLSREFCKIFRSTYFIENL